MFNKVLLPLDGSKVNRKTWNYAKHLIEKEGSHIEILYVNEDIWLNSEETECSDGICKTVNLFDLCDSNIIDINGADKNNKQDVICQIKTQLKDFFGEYNKNITMKIANGDVAHQITSISKTHDFDVIIMSPSHTSALKKLTSGSITHKVISHSEIPVLIVK